MESFEAVDDTSGKFSISNFTSFGASASHKTGSMIAVRSFFEETGRESAPDRFPNDERVKPVLIQSLIVSCCE